MSEEFGPWIEHDGKGFPAEQWDWARTRGFTGISTIHKGAGRCSTMIEQLTGKADRKNPAWVWVRRFGFFGPVVSSDPAYARVVKYRFFKKRPPAQSKQVERLRDIAASPPKELISDEAQA